MISQPDVMNAIVSKLLQSSQWSAIFGVGPDELQIIEFVFLLTLQKYNIDAEVHP